VPVTGFVGAAGTINLVASPDQRATIIPIFYAAGYIGNAIPIIALCVIADHLGIAWRPDLPRGPMSGGRDQHLPESPQAFPKPPIVPTFPLLSLLIKVDSKLIRLSATR
jgi:hypothetical protein